MRHRCYPETVRAGGIVSPNSICQHLCQKVLVCQNGSLSPNSVGKGGLLPKTFGFAAVFVAGKSEILADIVDVETEVFAQVFERIVFVAQFHIEERDEHVRVVGQSHRVINWY